VCVCVCVCVCVWNDAEMGSRRTARKTCPSATFVHHDPHVDCTEIEPRPPLAGLFWFPMPLRQGCLKCRRNETCLAWHKSCWISAPEMYPLEGTSSTTQFPSSLPDQFTAWNSIHRPKTVLESTQLAWKQKARGGLQ
jgi:hypothetical protein